MERFRRLWVNMTAEHEYTRSIIAGISTFFAETDYWEGRLGGWVDRFDRSPDDICETLSRFDAVITLYPFPSLCRCAAELGKPLVNVSSREPFPGVVSVIPDNILLGRLGAEHLLETGNMHFAFYPGGTDLWFVRDRRKGFEDAVRAAGRQVHPACASQDLRPWLEGLPRPLGVLCQGDREAIDVINACRRLQLNVPGDVAVVGIDNDPVCTELTRPRITSVANCGTKVGYEAMRTIVKIYEGERVPERTVISMAEVVARESSDTLNVSDLELREAVRFIRSYQRRDQLTVQAVADHVALTRRSLERRFREALGTSPWEEIRRVQLMRAKHLLAYTDLAIHEVAERAGFRETKHLSEFFREQTDMSPSDYRVRHGQQQLL